MNLYDKNLLKVLKVAERIMLKAACERDCLW